VKRRKPPHFRRQPYAAILEKLEPRNLLSFSFGGISIPSLPSLALPAFTNGLTLTSLTSFTDPNPADSWWLKNTGQTLTNPLSGPATGTPGADIAAQYAWNITTGNSNIVIAVLDTGIDLENADLASALWTNPGEIPGDGIDNDHDGLIDDIHGWNFLNNSNNVTDNFVHGTAVAATIHSVAPGITILPVEIGTAAGVDDQALANGINYLINLKQHGVNIVAINASYISFTPPTMDEINAIKSAGDNGMLYIAAAGNSGMNLDSLIPNVPSFLSSYIPSFLPPNLIFVAATDNQDHLASFSNYGPNTVAVGAPGVDITLPIPGGLYAPLSGTSFAAPMVSGIVGLLKSRFPTATSGQIKEAILKSGDLDPALAGKTITGRRVDALKALNYMMGNQTPTGAVEVLNNTMISGWAFDPNLGATAATVRITMDGVTVAQFAASDSREDLADTLGSSEHGFSYDTTGTPYGKHAMKVYVLDDATGKQTLIGQGTLTVTTAPTGDVESASAKSVMGWALDSDTQAKSTQVKLFLDGKAWMTASANIARPDLAETDAAGSHGYKFNLGTIKAGIHRVDVYAVDSLTGALTLIGSETISSNRAATGAVETLNATTVSGWAFDADAGTAAIQIQYQIDDFAPVFVTANVSRPDLVGTLGMAAGKNHGFSVALPQLTVGEHTIVVRAVDPNNKMLVELASQTIVVNAAEGVTLPTGEVTTFTNGQVAGVVTAASGPARIRVDVDGKAGVPFAGTAAGDEGEYTFSYNLPGLVGPHRVDVWAMDDGGTAVLIGRRMVNAPMPMGVVETFTAQGVVGYAVAGAGVGGAVGWVRLDVDGVAGNLVTANLSRPELVGTLGRANVGFNIVMPKVAAGEHVATLYVIDPVTLKATVLGTLEFVTV